MNDATKSNFVSFCLENGIDYKKTPEAVEKQLKRLMGNNRYEKYLDITDQVHGGLLPIKNTYECMNSLKEANCLISHQAKIFVDVSFEIYSKIKDFIKPGYQIGDLGCYTGVFTKWLSSQHKDTRFIGFDALKRNISFSNESNSNSNLDFTFWDYSKPGSYPVMPCDMLITAFGLDFDTRLGRKWSLDTTNLRDCSAYLETSKEAYNYFSCWKEAIKPEGKLISVLRIGSIDHLISCIDGASKAGWDFDFNNSISINSDDEIFPFLEFRAIDSKPNIVSQDLIFDWWERVYPPDSTTKDQIDNFKTWHALPNKEIIKENSKTNMDGHTMVCVIGKSGDAAFSFSRATTGFTRLKVVPIDQLDDLQFLRS